MSWREVTKRQPCPACGKPDWCAWAPDGQTLKCERTAEAPPGFRQLKPKDGGALFVPEDAPGNGRAAPRPARRRPAPPERARPASTDWAARARKFERACTPERLEGLAQSLGVPADSLRALGVGWADAAALRELKAGGGGWREEPPEGAFTFPERDGRGTVVGLSLRAPDGRKGFPKGASRGLVVPEGLDGLEGPVLLVEGASDVAACHSLGLPAVGRPSNTGGAAEAAELLADRELLVVGERDGKPDGRWPGLEGAQRVAEELIRRGHRRVRWTLVPEGAKDVREWLGARAGLGGSAKRDELREELLGELVRVAQTPESAGAGESLSWRPFPTDLLPGPVAAFVEQAARTIGCDPALVAVPALVTCAGAVGLSRTIRPKRGWREPAVLWAALVMPSGQRKSPALDAATDPLEEIEREAVQEYRIALREHETRKLVYEKELAEWKHAKGQTPPPEKPEEPRRRRLLVTDTTLEALASLLGENPRGLLLKRDELAGWLESWNQYKGGKGGDEQGWLELHRGGRLCVDRKGRKDPLIADPAGVSIIGTVQPGILRRLFGPQRFESGLVARMLFVMPPVRRRRWSEDELDGEHASAWRRVVERLATLEMRDRSPRGPAGEDGAPPMLEPVEVPLSREGRELFRRFVDEHGFEQTLLDERLSAAWAKLEGYALSLALVVHLMRWAAGEEVAPSEIDEESMRRGIVLARWFAHETRRVYEMLGAGERDREREWLLERIRALGGRITPRKLAQGPRRYRKPGAARKALDELVAQGFGEWRHERPGPKGGAPGPVFVLHPDPSGDATPSPGPTGGGSVAVAASPDIEDGGRGDDQPAGSAYDPAEWIEV